MLRAPSLPPVNYKFPVDVRQEDKKVIVEWPFVYGRQVLWLWLFMLVAGVLLLVWTKNFLATMSLGAVFTGAATVFCGWWLLKVVPLREARKTHHMTQLAFHVDGQIDLPWVSMRGLKQADLVSDRTWHDISHAESCGAGQWGWKPPYDRPHALEPYDVFIMYKDGGREILMRSELGRDFSAQIAIGVNRGIEAIRQLGTVGHITGNEFGD